MYICTTEVWEMSRKQSVIIKRQDKVLSIKKDFLRLNIADQYVDKVTSRYKRFYSDPSNITTLKNVWNLRSYDQEIINQLIEIIKTNNT